MNLQGKMFLVFAAIGVLGGILFSHVLYGFIIGAGIGLSLQYILSTSEKSR